jgi:DNA-binding CsgD family transcriptional regulator
LINIGSVRLEQCPDDVETLLEGHDVAHEVGERHEVVRALLNLGYSLLDWLQPALARVYAERAVAYAREHQVDTLGAYAATIVAWLDLREGEWSEAERAARTQLESISSVTQLLARTVLAELAVRRGDEDAATRLTELAAQADRTGEPQRLGPVFQLEVEWCLTTGAPMPEDRWARVRRLVDSGANGLGVRQTVASAAVAGFPTSYDGPLPPAQAAMVARDWRRAADAFGELGWSYDRALMLTLLDDASSLVEALGIARDFGADPLANRVVRRMHELGMRVPRGSRSATRVNPAGLTARELEVLRLLQDDRTNAEIADALVVSRRTAEHHVAHVMAKLGATSRHDAVRLAGDLGFR